MSERPDPTPDDSEPGPIRRPRIRHRMRTPLEASQWRRRMAGYALVGVSFVLVVNAIVGENGYLATIRARRQQAELTESIQRLRDENRRMEEEILRIRKDQDALEEAARKGLRMSKPGETMIIIKEPAKDPAKPPKDGSTR